MIKNYLIFDGTKVRVSSIPRKVKKYENWTIVSMT